MKSICIMFGGPSAEYEASIDSTREFLTHVRREGRQFQLVGVTRTGDAYLYKGPEDAIWNGSWESEEKHELYARVSRKGVLYWKDDEGAVHELRPDACLPLIPGAYGEDGTVQGLLGALGIPAIGCSVSSSAVGFDKDLSHKIAFAAGVSAPRSVVCYPDIDDEGDILTRVEELGFPVYVKPARGGSSIGISKVESLDALAEAIQLARRYDEKVLIEENIVGVEVGLAVIGKKRLVTGEVDQVNTVNHFFSYEDKYVDTGESPIDDSVDYDAETVERIKQAALTVYRAIGCEGFVRVDLFLDQEGNIFFNEINTVPWLPAHGRYSKMLLRAGYSMEDIMEQILTAE